MIWDSNWEKKLFDLFFSAAQNSTEILKRRNPRLGAELLRVADGFSVFHGNAQMTGVYYLGWEQPVELAALNQLEQYYALRGVPVLITVNDMSDPALEPLLIAHGYKVREEFRTWYRPIQMAVPKLVSDKFTIVRINDTQCESWITTVAAGYIEESGPISEAEIPQWSRDIFASLGCKAGTHAFLALDKTVPVGGAAMTLGDGLTTFHTASTRFNNRGHGVQKQLLRERLSQSEAARAMFAIVSTSADESHPSFKNVETFGFLKLRNGRRLIKG